MGLANVNLCGDGITLAVYKIVLAISILQDVASSSVIKVGSHAMNS